MSEDPAGRRGATSALVQFASGGGVADGAGNAEEELANFDDADVSPAGIGDGIHDAQAWDGERGGLRLRGRQLAGASLRRANLARADLGSADLSGILGGGVSMLNACLEGADCSEADMAGAKLSAIDAGEANFSGALLEDANLTRAHLRFANFTDAIMDGADFSNADLWGARFGKAAAERTLFRSARLDESSLAEADLSEADFTGATLRRAGMVGARLRGATFRDAVLDGADLTRADLSRAVLTNISLATCTLEHASFHGAWLERTRMSAAQLGGRVGEEVAGNLDTALDSYVVLERNFLSLGNSEDASWAYRRRRRIGRALHLRDARLAAKERRFANALTSGAQWAGDVAAEWLCDYGESLSRVARAFFTILIVFAVVYRVTGCLRVREGFTSTGIYTLINYLLFSLDSMTTVGTSEVALRTSGELGMLLSSVQTVVGTILLGLFGFVLGARIRN